MPNVRVLGIDLAMARWRSIGSALLEFDCHSKRVETVVADVLPGLPGPPSPTALAEAIDTIARRERCVAVALDGPQGWRDPATPENARGVGRRCEWSSGTPGKTGGLGTTYPPNQRWIGFSIEVFDALLAKADVRLVESVPVEPPPTGYWVAECFPTVTWRSAGLVPLPSKRKRPHVADFARGFSRAHGLPIDFDGLTHDNLQAIVAATCAMALVGGPAVPIAHGSPPRSANTPRLHRVEGLIVDTVPILGTASRRGRSRPRRARAESGRRSETPAVRVTRRVLEQVRSPDNGPAQRQIALRGFAPATRDSRHTEVLRLAGRTYHIIVGDTHAAWRSHQDHTTAPDFEDLFTLLADTPDEWRIVGADSRGTEG